MLDICQISFLGIAKCYNVEKYRILILIEQYSKHDLSGIGGALNRIIFSYFFFAIILV